MSRPPPCSALFPSTTLFRSRHDVETVQREHTGDPAEDARPVVGDDGEHVAGADRKSTRLNSSHMSTPYAVFCLKKKKSKPPASVTRSVARRPSSSESGRSSP